jgi:hypothetical protein
VRSAALDVHHEPDAAGVVLEAGVIQALGLRGHERSLWGHQQQRPWRTVFIPYVDTEVKYNDHIKYIIKTD